MKISGQTGDRAAREAMKHLGDFRQPSSISNVIAYLNVLGASAAVITRSRILVDGDGFSATLDFALLVPVEKERVDG